MHSSFRKIYLQAAWEGHVDETLHTDHMQNSQTTTWDCQTHSKWYTTCLENHLLAPDACSLQVNEGSHLFGPRMLGNEAVTGLTEKIRQFQPKWVVKYLCLSLHFTCRMFSSAPLKRKITPWWRGVDWLAREWRTSSITAQLTASSLAPETRKAVYCVCLSKIQRSQRRFGL